MTKTLKHYKKHHNRTRRLRKKGGNKRRKQKGGITLSELKQAMNRDNHHFVALHSSPTCGHCKKFEPEWDEVLASLPQHPNLTVAKLGQDETDFMNHDHYRKHNYAVNGVPTIVYYVVNKAPREYDGERTSDKIIEWITKTMKENNLEVTIKPKQDQVSYEEPEEVPASFESDLLPPASATEAATEAATDTMAEAATDTMADAAPDTMADAATATEPDTMADAFPAAPLSPASIAGTVSTAATDLNNTLKSATESATAAVSSTVSNISDKLNNLFSSSAETAPSVQAPVAPAPAAAPTDAQEATAPLNVPQVPSLVGGLKRRKITRRKHRKSKSTRKSKKSKKSRK
jgi:hypothetical protein